MTDTTLTHAIAALSDALDPHHQGVSLEDDRPLRVQAGDLFVLADAYLREADADDPAAQRIAQAERALEALLKEKETMTDTTSHHERTRTIDRLQKRHPGTRRQRNEHGGGKYSVEFFDRATGKLVARYEL